MKKKTPHTWKDVELRVAELFGGHRNPLSGSSSRHTTGDAIEVGSLYIEVKHGSKAELGYAKVVELLFKTNVKAVQENKVPVVVLHEKRSRDTMAWLYLTDLIRLLKIADWLHPEQERAQPICVEVKMLAKWLHG